MPFTYAGTDTVDGIQAYRFTENVSPTQNGTQVLPGSLVGESQASVVLPQCYEMHPTYWIDPDTGALLNATEDEKLTLRNSQGAQALLLLDANLAMTPASVNGLVALDNTQRSKMTLVTTILPLVTGIVGVILLIVGILLSRRPREDVEGGASVTSPELAAAEPAEDADRSAQPVTQPSLVPGLDDEPQEATAESPAVQEEAVQPETEAEAAQAEAVQPEAEAEAAEPEAAQAEAVQPEAEAAQPEAAQPEAEAEPEAAQPEAEAEPEAAQAEAPAAESAETPQAEDVPAEAPTAEMSAATSESPEAATASAPADAPATTSRRGRRGSHRR